MNAFCSFGVPDAANGPAVRGRADWAPARMGGATGEEGLT